MDITLVEQAAFPIQAVVAQHLPMVAHEHDNGVFPLASFLKIINQTAQLVVQMFCEGIVFQHVFPLLFVGNIFAGYQHPALGAVEVGFLLESGLVVQLPIFP